MNNIAKEDIQYIQELYDKKDTHIRPDVRRVIRLYNQLMPDDKHIFHPVSEEICACSLRPYLIQLYRKMETLGLFKDETKEDVKEKKVKSATNNHSKRNGGKKAKNIK